jgi:phosphomevalonate kinase
VTRFRIPPGFSIHLADISGGSNTPKMVAKLMEWQSYHVQECEDLWQSLSLLNRSIYEAFNQLEVAYSQDSKSYISTIDELALCKCIDWTSISPPSLNVRDICVSLGSKFQSIRIILKKMGEFAGVAIEPDEQSIRLDACQQIPGILLGGVPGGNR